MQLQRDVSRLQLLHQGVFFHVVGNELREQAHHLFTFEIIRLLLSAGGAEGTEQRAVGQADGNA